MSSVVTSLSVTCAAYIVGGVYNVRDFRFRRGVEPTRIYRIMCRQLFLVNIVPTQQSNETLLYYNHLVRSGLPLTLDPPFARIA